MTHHTRRKEDRASEPVEQLRATQKDDGNGFVAGYASTWWLVDSYLTAMAPGAFTESLKQRGDLVRVLYNHNPEHNFAVPEALREDERGLYTEATVIDDGDAGSTFLKRARGGVKFGMSFGFRELRGRPATENDPLDFKQEAGRGWADIWVIEEVKLYEFSMVPFAANEDAAVIEVRKAVHVDALRQLYDDIRNGALDDDELAAITRITDALDSAAPQHSDAARTEVSPLRFLDVDLALARFGSFVDKESA